nr:ribonuclease H-like domain-containing protein [Tanacetum cinerariifolium]
MSFITAQQAKLDLELVPKEKRLEIGKCSKRLNPRKIQREPTFQVILDALALTPCYSTFLITAYVLVVYMHQFWDSGHDFDALPTDKEIVSFLRELRHIGEINLLNDVVVDYMHQPWRTFAALINKSLSERTTDKTVSWRNNIGMHTSKDDYLINTLRFVYAKEETQIYGAILPESLTSPEIKETKAYKTYLGFASGATPPKKAKCLRDFHKTHPNGSGTVTKTAPSAAKIKPSVTNERTGVKPAVPNVTEEESSKSETKSWGNDEDDSNNEQDSRSERSNEDNDIDDKNTQSDSKKGLDSEHETDENESKSKCDQEENEEEIGDDEEEEDEYSSHPSDLASKFLNFSNIPYTDAEIVSLIDVHVHHEVPSKQTPTLLTVPISVITESLPIYSIVIPQSIPSFTPLPPQSTPTPPPTTLATNPPSTLLDFTSVFQFNNKVIALEKEVVDLKKDDPLKTQVPALRKCLTLPLVIQRMITESLNHAILAKESSQLQSSYEAAATLIEFESRKDKDKDEDPSTRSDRGLKKRKTSKDAELTKDSDIPQDQEEIPGNDDEEPKGKVASKRPTQSWLMTLASSVDKLSNTFDELMSTPIDFSAYIMYGLKITNLTQETLLGLAFRLLKGIHTNYAELEYDFQECYKALSEKLDWENLKGGDYPFDLTKPLPLVMNGNRKMVLVDYFFNNGLKYMQGGILTMTSTASLTKTKDAQYDLPGIEDIGVVGFKSDLGAFGLAKITTKENCKGAFGLAGNHKGCVWVSKKPQRERTEGAFGCAKKPTRVRFVGNKMLQGIPTASYGDPPASTFSHYMQKRRNDVKARTTLLLALPDEHQLRFNKYKTAKELWEAILKTFGGNEATKKTKKNQLKLQYDDLNQKFLTSLAPEWLMYTIVWRNRDDLDTMNLDNVYNHLKVYEPEVQKKSGSNSQNMNFISTSNNSSRKASTDSCWTCGNPFHSYKNYPEEIASRKERVPETYDYRSQYDAYEYDTYHANQNIEMEDDTMYRGITVLDFDDEDEDEEQNEEFSLHSTNSMEYSTFGSCKNKEDVDDHNNTFKDLISPIKEHDKE